MVPLLGVWALWQFRGQRMVTVRAPIIPVVAVAVMVPWWVRNYAVFHRFIPISTMSGSGLLQGNNRIVAEDPQYLGYSYWDSKIPEYRDALRSTNDELVRDDLAKSFAVRWLKDNPDKWMSLAWAKLVRAWTPFLQPQTPRLYRIGTLLPGAPCWSCS